MNDFILYVSITASVISLMLLLFKPLWGVYGIFIAKPLVDATWAQSIIGDFKLTEIISSLVPIIIFARMGIDDSSRKPFQNMPLKWIWLIYTLDTIQFSTLVMFDEDWRAGLSVLMRHLNGLAGFYMVQAYCRTERDFFGFAWAMAIAGLFPMASGLVEGVTGAHWSITLAANDVVRNIGFYHDAITIRCFALQTILALLLIYALGDKRSFLRTVVCIAYGAVALFVVKGAYSKSGVTTVGAWLVLWPVLRKNVAAMIAAGAAAVVATIYFASEFMDSVGFIFASEIGAAEGKNQVNETFAGRWGIWADMLRDWQGYPLMAKIFGAGHMANGAHNDYLQLLFHGGWFGLFIYVTLLLAVAVQIGRMLWTRLDTYGIAALFVFIMWIVDSIGLVPSAYSGYQWFVWGVIGYSLRRRQDEASEVVEVRSPVAESPRFSNLIGAA